MKGSNARKVDDKKNERGSVLAISAFAMIVLLLSTGLCIHISYFYLVKTELQNAADASVLAGASGLNSSAAGITEATNRAVQQMNNYEFNKTAITIQRTDVLFAVNLSGPFISETDAKTAPQNIRFIQVSSPAEPINVFFASMVLGATKSLKATATSGCRFRSISFVIGFLLSFLMILRIRFRRVASTRFAPRQEILYRQAIINCYLPMVLEAMT